MRLRAPRPVFLDSGEIRLGADISLKPIKEHAVSPRRGAAIWTGGYAANLSLHRHANGPVAAADRQPERHFLRVIKTPRKKKKACEEDHNFQTDEDGKVCESRFRVVSAPSIECPDEHHVFTAERRIGAVAEICPTSVSWEIWPSLRRTDLLIGAGLKCKFVKMAI
ncbi:hypothetical protein ROHU_016140 [Labeo rohita]|uniref:Uncharacterized protein n=1 Tax=Labeo rohita TaxID=84645 RepID=A0A498NKX7_LABRO|nr:hypothetical protein ROHU_016140 [Labeo rohita]